MDLHTKRDLFISLYTDENWLNSVFYSLSPTGELLVIAHGSKLVLLTSRWNNDQTTYTYTLKVELENPNDIITSLTCLPIVGNIQVSAMQLPAWIRIKLEIEFRVFFFCSSHSEFG